VTLFDATAITFAAIAPPILYPIRSAGPVSRSSAASALFEGEISQFVLIEMPGRNIEDRESANRHNIEVVTVSINRRGQIAYLGSP
jgi:hypothetical protein